jgi:hypothetical protein
MGFNNNVTIKDDYAIIHITNTKGEEFESIVDVETIDLVKKINVNLHVAWLNDVKGYYVRGTRYLGWSEEKGRYDYKIFYLHREIVGANKRDIVDHINKNTLDNRKSNLRKVGAKENTKNRKGANTNSKTGVRNVSLIHGKYVVQLQVDGKNTVFGRFDNLEDAAKLAKQKRKEIYGEYAG